MKPNFLVIGAPRASTTWIARNIMEHPDVYVPRAKELHFFDRQFDKGLDFYEANFSQVGREKAIGDVTPDYLADPKCPARISTSLENLKFIVTLRNPVDRLYSRYWNAEGKKHKRTGRSFEERLIEVPSWTEEGYYDTHLSRYFNYFSREQFLVLFFDDLKARPADFLRSIFEFLDVDAEFTPARRDHVMNAAGAKPLNARSASMYWLHRVARRLGFDKLSSYLDEINTKSVPVMSPETRRQLLENTYAQTINNIEDMFSRDMSAWRN